MVDNIFTSTEKINDSQGISNIYLVFYNDYYTKEFHNWYFSKTKPSYYQNWVAFEVYVLEEYIPEFLLDMHMSSIGNYEYLLKNVKLSKIIDSKQVDMTYLKINHDNRKYFYKFHNITGRQEHIEDILKKYRINFDFDKKYKNKENLLEFEDLKNFICEEIIDLK